MRTGIKGLFALLLGTVIIAFALDVFLVPADIAPGGVSGFAVILNHLTGLPLGISIIALNIPIFVIGFRYFSRKFMLFSAFGMLMLSIFTDAFAALPRISEDVLLSALYGGALLGLGIGIVFASGCTTGGTDIVAQVLRKKFPFVSVGRFVLLIDAVIVTLAGLVFGKWEVILYSSLALYISTVVIDLIVEGGASAKVAYIISDRQKQLADYISTELERGATVLHGSSFYSGDEKMVLLCVVRRYEVPKLKNIIKEVDQKAFVIFSDAREVLGKGFGSH